MTKRMLIDATHAEETRVVVLDGNRLEDFDVEAATKKQLKGNIYLAKVVRVEPSLQAAFVEYGGGRHGFLAFGEIHPDYYQIPVADRQRLLKMQAEEAAAEAAAEDEADSAPPPAATSAPAQAKPTRGRRGRSAPREAALEAPAAATAYGEIEFGAVGYGEVRLDGSDAPLIEGVAEPIEPEQIGAEPAQVQPGESDAIEAESADPTDTENSSQLDVVEEDEAPPEEMGGDSDVFEGNGAEEAAARRTSRFLRNYRIQEVIRRRQIMLIQVVKEERGSKGAALTTYISLAGRFCVLMPNSPRGGGISRKITSAADRRRLKEITAELEVPQGMGLIVRTAGANRPKPEIRRDAEYLMRLWDDIRELTLKSMAPALIYEEASLIKRAIRDGYSRDIDEVVVDGEQGWRAARDFMRMLMPSHAKKVQLWRPESGPGGAGQPLFAKHGVEDQLDSMLVPTVQLKSGGYLVINQAEALVAIDVNSGRSTRERGIEETALRTNLEAAEEAARQLRLRDLAGLIVIDFIDMESKRNNAMVERRLKEALKNDRARIQIGQISHFGLLEMSRQRLRPSLTETSFITCPHCSGLGLVRNVESSAIHVLREIEEEGAKARAGHIMVHVANAVAMFLLNNKRERLAEIEARYAMRVHFSGDDTLVAPAVRIDRLRPPLSSEERASMLPMPVAPVPPPAFETDEDDDDAEEMPDIAFEPPAAVSRVAPPVLYDEDTQGTVLAATEAEDASAPPAAEEPSAELPSVDMPAAEALAAEALAGEASGADEAERRRRRRRRRRGGRREDGEDGAATASADGENAEDAVPMLEPVAATAPDDMAGPETVAEPVVAIVDPAAQEQPTLDPEELDENGLPKARRRGRRGGRRRRRDEEPGAEGGEPASEPGAEPAAETVTSPLPMAPPPTPPPTPSRAAVAAPPPPRAPVYTGPTPADPFGGAPFDIFDILERAELAEQEKASRAAAALEIPPVPAGATAPSYIVAEPTPPPVIAPVREQPAEPAKAAPAAIPVVAELATAASGEPLVGPTIKPIVLGADPLPAAAPRRGWWKR